MLRSYLDAGDLSILGEHVGKLLLTQLFAQVLDEDIGEPLSFFSKLQLTLQLQGQLRPQLNQSQPLHLETLWPLIA